MEATFSKQLKVGVFTLIGITILAVSILLLGGGQSLIKSTYELRVRFDQVQGLARGSIVTLSGFPIGNVSEIRFLDQENMLEVVMRIDKSHQARITEGSVASVKTQGALGDKYIFISPNRESKKILKDDDILVSGESADFIDQIAKKGDQLEEIMDTVREAHLLLKNLNKDGGSGRVMKSLADSADSLKKFTDTGREGTLGRLNSILDKIDRGDGTLGSLINDPGVYRKINGMLGESRREKFLSPLIESTK